MSRNLTYLVVLVGTLQLSACGSIDLDDSWLPLERVVESPAAGEGVAFTVGPNVYVRDIDDMKARKPGQRWNALLMHEQVHSRRQAKDLVGWLARYGSDPAFAWAEEQRGWAAELIHLQRSGFKINPEGVASALAKYRTTLTRQPIVGFLEALGWVRDVLAGRWKP